jgi:hypothetical protein
LSSGLHCWLCLAPRSAEQAAGSCFNCALLSAHGRRDV